LGVCREVDLGFLSLDPQPGKQYAPRRVRPGDSQIIARFESWKQNLLNNRAVDVLATERVVPSVFENIQATLSSRLLKK